MSRTINTHVYALQGMTEPSATYGASISGVPYTAKFANLVTRQGGVAGSRISRSIQKIVVGADGTNYPVVVSVSVFKPDALPSSDVTSVIDETKALMAETGFEASVANKSLE